MKKRTKFLEILNSKLVIILLIFGLFFLATIFAGNVFVTDGDLDVDGQISQLGASRIKAVRSTAQTIPDSTYTTVQYNTEDYDNLGEYDSISNYRFTASEEGYYYISAGAGFERSAYGKEDYVYVRLYVNGVADEVLGQEVTSYEVTAILFPKGSTIIHLNANDYIEIKVYQCSGGNVNLRADSSMNYFTVHRVS